MVLTMKRKKIIFIVAGMLVALVVALAVFLYIRANRYTVKQITIAPKDMVLYADGKPVDFVIIDKNVPRKLVTKDDAIPSGDEVKLWIE